MIAQRIDLPDLSQAVLIDVGGEKDILASEYNSNVYRIDAKNNVIWQVSVPSSKMGRDSFVDAEFENGVLRANRFFGGEYIVDIATGTAEESGWHK